MEAAPVRQAPRKADGSRWEGGLRQACEEVRRTGTPGGAKEGVRREFGREEGYLRGEGRGEREDGEFHSVSPSPAPSHSRAT